MSKLETNTIDTVSGTSTLQVGSTNTSTITLGVSGDTINVPSGVTINNNGTQTGFGGVNTPAFRAYKSSGNQAISAGADTVITFDAESFDTAGNFASNKFTPQTAGKFFLNANLIVSTANNEKFYVIYISKNGTLSAEKWYRPGSTGTIGMSVSTILTANGSSDYFDVQFYGELGEDIVAGERKTFFEGYKIIE